MEKIRNMFDTAIDEIRESIENVKITTSNKIYPFKINCQVLKNGYSSSDVYNVGDSVLHRIVEILDYALHTKYKDYDQNFVTELKYHVDTIKAYESLHHRFETLLVQDGFSTFDKNGSRVIKKDIEKAVEQVRENFLKSWKWIGQNVFSPHEMQRSLSANNSVLYTKPYKMLSEVYMTNTKDAFACSSEKMHYFVLKKFSIARNRIQQIISHTSFNKIDVENLPFGELLYISMLLDEMSQDLHGYPFKYFDSNLTLKKREKYWKTHQSLTAAFKYSGEDNPFVEHEENSSTVTVKKNQENLDFSAWIEDICFASYALAEYCYYYDENGYRCALIASGIEEKQIKCFDKIIHKNFISSWNWIAKNIDTLWD